ncbi:hypothetical protein TIFTF001_054059 [Ficus carica]|uniref:Uncharacterized protein n=1 Tax=Ficus carica TaxID=3494 RepID=A0AA88EDS8_FICCA|nr:hypothetical protein TIFTF001_054059 [Ficus carica]
MGSSRRDLRSGAHLCSVCCRSTPVKVGQRRSKLVNAGQSRSTPVKVGQHRSTLVNCRRILEDRLSDLFLMFRTCLQPQICDMKSRRLRMAIKSSVARN